MRGKQVGRQRQRCVAQAGRGGVDDNVECLPSQLGEAAGFRQGVGLAGEFEGETEGFFFGAVGERQCGRPGFEQGQDDAARRAAGAEQQEALAGEVDALIVGQVTHQSGAVGVVAANRAVGKAQRIHRARCLGARRQRRGQPEGFFLEWYGDIGAPAAGADECLYGRSKAVEWRQQGFVAHRLPCLSSKQGVDAR